MPVVLDVQFGGFGGVMGGVVRVSLRRVRVVSGRLVVPSLVVLSGLVMVLRGVLVVLGRFTMMLCCLF
jgi:hypothetical protein